MVKKVVNKEQEKLDLFLKSDYYNKVIRAWFIALKKAEGNPNKIMKKYLLEDGGIIYHQRFNQHIGDLETLYKFTRIKFCKQVKTVAQAYNHTFLGGNELY